MKEISGMLQVQSFVFNPFQENTYILHDETKECVVVDPGCYEDHERQALKEYISDHRLNVKLLLNTHCHIDHILGNAFIKDTFKVNLLIHRLEEPVLKAGQVLSSNYGFNLYQDAIPNGFLEEGDTVKVGNETFSILFVPGHSPGHVAFYNEKNRFVLGGDVLFYNSIGRTDLPGGNHELLIQSIHTKLFTLPDYVKVYPGHGPETTIGFEKKTNPFCALTDVNSK